MNEVSIRLEKFGEMLSSVEFIWLKVVNLEENEVHGTKRWRNQSSVIQFDPLMISMLCISAAVAWLRNDKNMYYMEIVLNTTGTWGKYPIPFLYFSSIFIFHFIFKN